ncbi:type I phosphodiesterase/nucleotide pyrophosphatase [Isosphaera pallida ATCC 43644]|uniref:Type I phosphodiesterase/nucleotide pyrophosphatase n=1 Tax=Isosphaera pallida (strain ATCC 43644 / DSM 9630 / IS1B) TaxID=575540 RepID=E8QX53_ISOPI|nr:alkaline phosphatase family protein [Isosphaera pallida]ADV60886.1 type I phosphodiesterase/nucleotide pyrophosphatase [Isosphaera pallida ATCC 43644]
MSSTRFVRRVIVIGLDGLSPRLIEEFQGRGELPHLAELRRRGGFSTVATTAPAQTPVAWSSFATSRNPGGHGIFDFLTRDPASHRVDMALNRYERPNPLLPPRVVNLRGGDPVWSVLARAGIPSQVLRPPCAYPPDPGQGQIRLLSGLGVPDLRGGFGTATFFTEEPEVRALESERVVRLERKPNGELVGSLIGPRDAKGDLVREIKLKPRSDGPGLLLEGVEGGPVALEPGVWSGWTRVKFKAGLLRSTRGIVRWRLERNDPPVRLYASPVNFDPHSPLFPISEPPEYAGDLADTLGLYATTGMVEDHAGLANGRLDEAAFLNQCDLCWREREAMLRHALNRSSEGLIFCLFDTPDRIQHLFWRYWDDAHPAHRGRPRTEQGAAAILDAYKRADTMAGLALEAADDQTLVIALSDHGFDDFRRGVGLNAWLQDQGLLTPKPNIAPGDPAGDYLQGIDWSNTQAYSVGLGAIFLNLQGREAQGIVPPDEAAHLAERIAAGLTGLIDPQTGQTAITRALCRDAIFQGPYVNRACDVLVHFAPGYRVAWGSSAGRVDDATFQDNDHAWSGDHVIDPDRVPGFLAMNRPYDSAAATGPAPRLIDLAPTITKALGVPAPDEWEGRSLIP